MTTDYRKSLKRDESPLPFHGTRVGRCRPREGHSEGVGESPRRTTRHLVGTRKVPEGGKGGRRTEGSGPVPRPD